MLRILLSVIFLWLPGSTLAAQVPESESRDPLAPARPHGLGGVGGFKTVSTVEFIGYPHAPHEWTVVYAYPDRARWSLKPTTGTPTSPMIVLRFGAHSWNIEGGQPKSKEDDIQGPRTTLIQMELRRAVNIWPLGFTWKEESKSSSRAEVFRLQHERDKSSIGHLLAYTGKRGKLLRIEAYHADGSPVEELEIKAWKKYEGRLWPSEILLLKDGKEVWKESLTFASARAFHNDLLFTPPDRREASVASSGLVKVRHIDLPGVTLRLKKLKPGMSWPRALKLFEKEHKLAQKKLDRERENERQLDSVPAFQLDANGQPSFLILRFKKPILPAPKGWKTLVTRPGVGTVLGDLESVNEALLKSLGSALPRDAHLAAPYCRIFQSADRTSVQVYQPILATE